MMCGNDIHLQLIFDCIHFQFRIHFIIHLTRSVEILKCENNGFILLHKIASLDDFMNYGSGCPYGIWVSASLHFLPTDYDMKQGTIM
jgi:hypothetical protein